jgi:hypothetical protein
MTVQKQRAALLFGLTFGTGLPGLWAQTSGTDVQTTKTTAPVGSEQNPVRISGGVMAGQILTRQTPVFPQIPCGPGTSVLAVTIDPVGKVIKATPISGAESQRGPVLEAVRHWTYKPFLVNGAPVFVQTTIFMELHFGAPCEPSEQQTDSKVALTTQAAAPVGSLENPAQFPGGVVAGHVLHRESLIYPRPITNNPAAENGGMVLAIIIDPTGRVSSVRVISGPEPHRAPAVEAVKRWTYKPFLLDGKPVFVQATLTLDISYTADALSPDPPTVR